MTEFERMQLHLVELEIALDAPKGGLADAVASVLRTDTLNDDERARVVADLATTLSRLLLNAQKVNILREQLVDQCASIERLGAAHRESIDGLNVVFDSARGCLAWSAGVLGSRQSVLSLSSDVDRVSAVLERALLEHEERKKDESVGITAEGSSRPTLLAAVGFAACGCLILGYALWSERTGLRFYSETLDGWSIRILQHVFPFVLGSTILGIAAGLLRTPSADEKNPFYRVPKYGFYAASLSVAILTGAKVTKSFVIAEGPQVVFVGSGTVQRFLFSGADDDGVSGLEIQQGVALGEHGVRIWSFEGGSSDGIGLATYAYAHHGNSADEKRVALVAMTSASLFSPTSDGGHKLTVAGKAALSSLMQTDNRAADDFLVLPLLFQVRPNLYCRGECPGGSVYRVGTSDGGISKLVFCGAASTPPEAQFFLAGASGATRAMLPEWDGGACVGGPRETPVAAHNFSLDLTHIEKRDAGAIIALGNFATGLSEAWGTVPCSTCTARDLSLVIPVSETKEMNASTCMALKVMAANPQLRKIEDWIDFAGCRSVASSCTCRPRGSAGEWVLEGLAGE